MLRMGAMPMPPAKNTGPRPTASSRMKAPTGRVASTQSPGARECILSETVP